MKVKVYAVMSHGFYADDYELLAEYEVPEEEFEKKKKEFIEYWKNQLKEEKEMAVEIGLLTKFPMDVNKIVIETEKEEIVVSA